MRVYNDRIRFKHGVGGVEEVIGEHFSDVFLGRAEERTGWITERKRTVRYDGDLHLAVVEALKI